MLATPRPLPRVPPHLTLAHPVDIRSYRPLPTPPLQLSDSSRSSSTESLYLQTPPAHTTSFLDVPPLPYAARDSSSSLSSFASFASASSEPLSKPRPRLRISVTSPTLRKRNSLDSLTVRSPALCDPDQTLSPVVDRRNNPMPLDQNWYKRAPHTSKRFSRLSTANSVVSPLVFRGPTVITEPDICESEEDELVLVPRVLQPKNGISSRVITSQPPRPRPIQIIMDRIEINYPVTPIRDVTNVVGDDDSDDETIGLNPHTVSSVDLTSGRESRASTRKNWKPFPSIAKVAMKSHLFRPKARPTKSSDAPVADAKRISQLASPLDHTWYKERDGWRWVERDAGEVLAELRKLR
ncbi:hypothetical protein BDM02DRAFT_3183167 [Thelephora ganbajun]|uniref:Uncharacterized protein n=1 Tax=Thelephora ganbajun TaxID=370292 RepID=A0ACB6ZUF8_THEGA|nr:hypothetical protein BDM02DRAFT_3183167 [Thelephora ganbajun]